MMGLTPMQRNDLTMEKVDLSYINIFLSGKLLRNLSMERLIEEGIINRETKMSMNGATMVGDLLMKPSLDQVEFQQLQV